MPVLSFVRATRHSKCTEKESIWDSREESIGGRARVSLRERLWVFTPIVSLTIYTASTSIIQFSIPPSDLSPTPRHERRFSTRSQSAAPRFTESLGVRVMPSVGGRNSLNTRALYSMELESSSKGTRRSCRQRTGGSVVTKTRTVRM